MAWLREPTSPWAGGELNEITAAITTTTAESGSANFNLKYAPFADSAKWDGLLLGDEVMKDGDAPAWTIRNGVNDKAQDDKTTFTAASGGVSPWHDGTNNGNGAVRFTVAPRVVNLTDLVPKPVMGGTPVTSFLGPKYTGTVEWKETGGDAHSGLFEKGKVYTATVTLTAAAGFTFKGLESGAVTHGGGTASLTEGGTAAITVTIAFPAAEGIKINVALTNGHIPAPQEAGDTPKTMFRGSSAGLSFIGLVRWYIDKDMKKQLTGNFQAETPYWTDVTIASQLGSTIDKVTYRYEDNVVSHSFADDGAVKCRINFPYLKVGANGSGPFGDNTTTITGFTLTLNPVLGLSPADIVLSGPDGIAKDGLTAVSAGAKYRLSVTGIKGIEAVKDITVRIKKGDYANLPPKEPQAPPKPTTLLAEGGAAHFVLDDGQWYEVHTFTTVGTHSLSFFDIGTPSITADYLIVAGGGGGGNPSSDGKDQGGGGGAGGLQYETGETLTLTSGSIAVTVGKGGGANADGGYSYLGSIKVPGGGRGGNAAGTGQVGGNGGSGGGDGSSTWSGEPTTVSSGQRDTATFIATSGDSGPYSKVWGHGGGLPQNSGGGGGGAKGVGKTGDMNAAGGTGGAGWKPSTEGAAWIADVVTGTTEFSHGGWGRWYYTFIPTGTAAAPAVNYGDGGNASYSLNRSGHSGIVVIRFPR
jgi:hypothetical protein